MTEFLPPYFPSPTSWTVRVGEGSSCGGTDSGTSAPLPSYPLSPFSLNVA